MNRIIMIRFIFLEVVSKPQIRFKGPAKRDYISDLKKFRYASRRPANLKRSVHASTRAFQLGRDNAAIGPEMGFGNHF